MAVLKICLSTLACVVAFHAQAQTQPLSREQIRQLTRDAALAAHITPGAMVCKRFTLGATTDDWVRAKVLTVDAESAVLRIIDPGRHIHEWRGRMLGRGSEISANLTEWTPCS